MAVLIRSLFGEGQTGLDLTGPASHFLCLDASCLELLARDGKLTLSLIHTR